MQSFMTTKLVHRPFDSFEQAANTLINAKRSENTRMAYRADLRRWLAFCFDNSIDPHGPTLMDTTMFRDRMRATMAEGSARRTIAGLSSIHKLLLAGRVVRANPFHPAVLAWPPANTSVKTQIVSDTDATAMIENAEQDRQGNGTRDAAILRVLYDTGLRRASVAGLRREDYRKPTLRTVIKGGEAVEIELPASTIKALDRWLTHAPDSEYVFPAVDEDNHINVATINKLVTRRARAVGAVDVHPHCFRAAFATSGYDAELPEYEIQAGLHHKDPMTTRRYDRGARGGLTATKIAKFRGRKP
jgi:integrase/recombinase XerD